MKDDVDWQGKGKSCKEFRTEKNNKQEGVIQIFLNCQRNTNKTDGEKL